MVEKTLKLTEEGTKDGRTIDEKDTVGQGRIGRLWMDSCKHASGAGQAGSRGRLWCSNIFFISSWKEDGTEQIRVSDGLSGEKSNLKLKSSFLLSINYYSFLLDLGEKLLWLWRGTGVDLRMQGEAGTGRRQRGEAPLACVLKTSALNKYLPFLCWIKIKIKTL